MGVDAPEQKGGLTQERSLIDPAITQGVQNQFSGSMDQLGGQMGALPGQMQYAGGFNPSNLNLQSSVDLQEASPFAYSEGFDPLVQGMLSQSAQNRGEALGAQKSNIAESLRRAPGNNQALIGALQADQTREAALQSNPDMYNALNAQRGMDVEKYGLNLNAINQGNQARLSSGQFANQSALAGRSAEENAYGIGLQGMGMNNQARLSALSPQMQYMGMLGQGLAQTAPRMGGTMTMADLKELQKHPEYIDVALRSGIIDRDTLARAGVGSSMTGVPQGFPSPAGLGKGTQNFDETGTRWEVVGTDNGNEWRRMGS